MTKPHRSIPLMLLALGVACGEFDGTVKEDSPGLFARATVSADSALALIRGAYPGVEITEAELEEEDDLLIYTFDLQPAEGDDIEVHINALTGKMMVEDEG